MVALVEHIECVVVASEAEALLAEQSFIKQHRPRFNIRPRFCSPTNLPSRTCMAWAQVANFRRWKSSRKKLTGCARSVSPIWV